MADYKKMYTLLFNGLTDCLEQTRELTTRIIALQRQAEEIYMEGEDAIVIAAPDNPRKPE